MKPILPLLFGTLVLMAAIRITWLNYPWWDHGDQAEKWFGVFLGTMATVIAGALSVGLGIALSSWIGSQSEQVWHRCWTGTMVSIRSADGIEGKLHGGVFLMSGHVNSAQIYYYYTRASDGAFKPHKWKADNDTSVYEEDRKDGAVVQYDLQFKRTWIEWFGVTDDRLAMEFHIPKGSLKQEFSLE